MNFHGKVIILFHLYQRGLSMSVRKMSEIRLKHIPQYILLVIFTFILRIIPLAWLYAVAKPLAKVLFQLDKKHRAICIDNLTQSFPEKSHSEIQSIAIAVYINMVKIFFEFLRLGSFFRGKTPERKFTFPNAALFERLLSEKKGIVVVTTHLGNWELEGGYTCWLKYKLNAIYFPQTNPLADDFFNKARSGVGINLIPNTVAVKKTIEHLRKNELVAFLADQDARGGHVFVDFFGRKAATVKGPVFFAVKTGAPMILAAFIRKPDNSFELHIEEVPISHSGDIENDLITNTQAWSTRLENLIRQYPDQWFWVHRRWKTRPEAEPT